MNPMLRNRNFRARACGLPFEGRCGPLRPLFRLAARLCVFAISLHMVFPVETRVYPPEIRCALTV